MIHNCKWLLTIPLLLATSVPCRAEDDPQLQRALSASQVPIEKVAAPHRDKVYDLLHHPVLYSRGPTESFPCQPGVYRWLLDHPQWGFRGWKALGATCAAVTSKDDGSFVGVDEHGSELRWQTVLQEPGRRLWLVEGTGRIAPLLPSVTIKALVQLRYQEVVGVDGRVGIRHRAELFAQFEEKAVSWLAKLSGMSADHAARKVVEQVELFFSGMAWYVSEHPAWAKNVFQVDDPKRSAERQEVEGFLRELPKHPDRGQAPETGWPTRS